MPGAERPELADARVRELARAILERPEYKNFRLETHDVVAFALEKLRALMAWLQQLHAGDPRVYWAVLVGLGAVCLALVLHIAWTLRAALRSAPPPVAPEARAQELDFAREARALAARGQHLEAAHRLLLASLRGLAQRRLIPLRPEDGNHAVCRLLATSRVPAELRGEMIALIVETERAWYGAGEGARRTPASLYQRWDSAYAQLAAFDGPAAPQRAARADAAQP